MQDSRAFVCAPPGDGSPEPWAYAGRHHGDPRLARYCVRGNRPVINLSGPIRDESLTPDRVTTPEDMRNSAAPLIWWCPRRPPLLRISRRCSLRLPLPPPLPRKMGDAVLKAL